MAQCRREGIQLPRQGRQKAQRRQKQGRTAQQIAPSGGDALPAHQGEGRRQRQQQEEENRAPPKSRADGQAPVCARVHLPAAAERGGTGHRPGGEYRQISHLENWIPARFRAQAQIRFFCGRTGLHQIHAITQVFSIALSEEGHTLEPNTLQSPSPLGPAVEPLLRGRGIHGSIEE